MEDAGMIFDPSQKKKKKNRTKKALDLDKALESAASEEPAVPGETAEGHDSSEVHQDGGVQGSSEGQGQPTDEDKDLTNMFHGAKKKSKKPKNVLDTNDPTDAQPTPDEPTKSKPSVKFQLPTNGDAQPPKTASEAAGRAQGYDKDNFDATERDYTYEELLTRVFSIIRERNPEITGGERKKFVMKPPQVSKLGTKKTAFANFADICRILKRPPKHLLQFLLAELGASGSVDSNSSLIIKGRFQQKQIEYVLRSYIKEYVTCHTCKSPDTELERDTRLFFLQCSSCKSRCSVASIQSGFKAVVGKRAVLRRKVQ